MEKIQDDLSLTLKRINFMFKNEKILTECIENHEIISLMGEKFGPFEKGNKYNLKFFIALPFIEGNFLKFQSSEKCDNVDVQRYAISESNDQKLVNQKNIFFLNKIKEFKSFIEKEIKSNQKPQIDLNRYNSYTANIIDSRLLKLLRLAKSEITFDDEQRLTYSEKIIYSQLNNIIKAWRTFFLSKI